MTAVNARFCILAALIVGGCARADSAVSAESPDVIFVAFGDAHYGDLKGAGGEVRSSLQIKAINAIELFTWPKEFSLAGQRIAAIRGVLLLGDITDNGKNDQLRKFESDFGLNGERLLNYPIMEGFGNHDFTADEPGASPHSFQYDYPVMRMIQRRNDLRSTPLLGISKQGGHYSWNWGNVHFVNLNLKASDEVHLIEKDGKAHRWIDPYDALSFLKQDLAQHAKAGQPVLIMQHYPPKSGDRMSRAELVRLRDALRPYKVIALLHAHTHRTRTYMWCGIPVFDVGSPHYDNKKSKGIGNFSVFRISAGRLEAASVGWRPTAPEQLIIPYAWRRAVNFKSGPLHDVMRGQDGKLQDECPLSR